MIIKLNDVSLFYGQDQVIKTINLLIEEGEYLAIIGKSGSGKTTLLNMIGGLLKPTQGEVWIDSQDITKMNDKMLKRYMRERIAFIFQDYHLVNELTVFENIQLPFFIKKSNYDKKYLSELLSLMELEDKLDQFPYELSGGQKQKVAAIRALLQKPKVLLCDEPTGNLDEKNTQELMNILKECHQKYNQTILLVTHDLDIARSMDRVLRLKDGMIDFNKTGDIYD